MAKRKQKSESVPIEPADVVDSLIIEPAWGIFVATSANRTRLRDEVAVPMAAILMLMAKEWEATAAAMQAITPDQVERVAGQRKYAQTLSSGLRTASRRLAKSFPTYELISLAEQSLKDVTAEVAKRKANRRKDGTENDEPTALTVE